MSDSLFAAVPFAALIICAVTAAIVCRRAAARDGGCGLRLASSAVRRALVVAAAAVAAEHLLLLIAPEAVLRWNVDMRRLIVLEAVGAIAGCACVAAALVALWRHVFGDPPHHASIARTLNLSVASVTIVSGVTIAVAYRWASSWSVVTLTPYVLSLSSAQPRVDLVASTPFLVRLHLLGAFASIALLPLGDTFAAAVTAARGSIRTMTTLVSRARATSGEGR